MTSPVVFNHIPKTAGTALTSALGTALGATRVRSGMDRSVLGDHEDLSSFARRARRMVVAGPEELPADVDLVAGHITPATTRARYPGARDLTVLREARTRLLSEWLFLRAHTDSNLRAWGRYADLVRLSRQPLADYLADPRAAVHTDNLMVRFLVWPHPAAAPGEFIAAEDEDELLDTARAVLAGFSHSDVIESPGFAEALAAWVGADLHLGSSNEMPAIPPGLRPDLDSELHGPAADLFTERTRLDHALWSRLLQERNPDLDAEETATASFDRAVQRYADRLARPPEPRQPLPVRLPRKVRHRLRQHRATRR